METRKQRRIGSELTTNARIEPIRVVRAAMRRTKRDTSIDATRAPEFLNVDPSNEPPKAVTNEIDAAAAHVPPEVLAQSTGGLLDPEAGAVVEREDLRDATQTKIPG